VTADALHLHSQIMYFNKSRKENENENEKGRQGKQPKLFEPEKVIVPQFEWRHHTKSKEFANFVSTPAHFYFSDTLLTRASAPL
jgi:hypothetical protein